jgi:PAS domain S-box-containing protein
VRAAFPEIEGQGYFERLEEVVATRQAFVGHGMRAMVWRTKGEPLEERFFDIIYQPITTGEGPVLGVFVQGHDITLQKQAERERGQLVEKERVAREEAEEAARELRFLADAIPQQIWTARPDGQLDSINEQVVAYFQAPRAKILGDGWLTVIHPDDLAPCAERWGRALATGEPYEVEFRLRRGDGEYRWHLGRAVAFRDPSGAIVRWFGTNTDIDEANRIREELRARSESEQRLIGIVSHDLRNPLNAIGLAASLLLMKRSPDDPEARVIGRMVASIERAGRLINDFLEFAQSRAGGHIPVHPRASNLRELAQQAVDEARLSDPSRTVVVRHEGEETGWWDSDRLAQVFGNLVGNAFQHSPPSEPITVASRIDGNEARIEIHNGGPPIPPGDVEHLFEPFRRGSRAMATRGRSVGLGLYIAQQVVVAHGGEITVTSAPGEGTRLTVRLPREVGAGKQDGKPDGKPDGKRDGKRDGKPEKHPPTHPGLKAGDGLAGGPRAGREVRAAWRRRSGGRRRATRSRRRGR